jgi:hypothetical protein
VVTVAECSSFEQAELLRSLLASCGIAGYLPEELSVTYRGVLDSFRVQVAEADAAAARAVLAENAP